jgi:PadR family transcriptional regulator, regulatory protein PadR
MNNQHFPKLSNKETTILEMLVANNEMFGLEMVESSAGELKRGTIYVTLQRMGEKGLVESREEPRPEGEIGIARRIYKPTGLGERVLKAQQMALEYLNLGWQN